MSGRKFCPFHLQPLKPLLEIISCNQILSNSVLSFLDYLKVKLALN